MHDGVSGAQAAGRGTGAASRATWRGSALVFVLAALGLFLTMSRGANIFDEGIVFDGAMRVLAGEVPHVDFYSCYGPAVYWSVALLFKLTGPSILAGRLLGLAVAAGAVALAHRLVALRARRPIAVGTAGLVWLWLVIIGSFTYSAYPCLLLALAGALLLAGPGGAARAGRLLGAGACAGLAALFRYDAGFFIMAALIAAAGLTCLAGRPGRPGRWAALLVGVGAGLVFVPGALAYLLPDPARGLAAFRADIIDYPLQWYGAMRGLPWPGAGAVLRQPFLGSVYLPLLVLACAAGLVRDEVRRLRAGDCGGQVPPGLLLALLAAFLFYKGTVRVSPLHMVMALVPALALAGLLLERWTAASRRGARLALAATAALVLTGFSGLRDPLHVFRVNPRGATWVWLAGEAGLVRLAPAPGELCPSWPGMWSAFLDADHAAVAAYLLRHSAPGDRVLAGLTRTDRIIINPMLLPYAANRRTGTHWSQYDPGLQNRADVQRQMVAELARGDVQWVVRDGSFDGLTEPNGSSWHSGVTLLDDYVDAHFRPVGQAGAVALWLRADLAAPDPSRDPAACRLGPA